MRVAVWRLHGKFKNLPPEEVVACNCDTCMALMQKREEPSFYEYKRLKSKIENGKYFEECEKSQYQSVNIGRILNDVVVEKAMPNNPDGNFLHILGEEGLGSICRIDRVDHLEIGKER